MSPPDKNAALATNADVVEYTTVDDPHRIVEPRRIEVLIAALFEQSARAEVRPLTGDPGGRNATAVSAMLTPDRHILVSLGRREGGVDPPYRVSVRGLYADYVFDVHASDFEGGRLVGCPRELRMRVRSEHRRVNSPPRVSVRFKAPRSSGDAVERRVGQVSFDGLTFAMQAGDVLLRQGMHLQDLKVCWKGGPVLSFSAEVKRISSRDSGEFECDVALLPHTLEDAHRWEAEVSRLLNPRTTSELVEPDGLWTLYANSGYFSLSGDERDFFAPLRERFRTAVDKLHRAPRLGCQAHVTSGRRVEASLSAFRAWEQAWITCQLARDTANSPLRLSGNRVLLDLYLHLYEQARRDPMLKWHVTYIRKDARFSRLLHHDFVAKHLGHEGTAIIGFRPMQRRGVSKDPPPPATMDIGVATRAELQVLVDRVEQTVSPAYREMIDLTLPRIEEENLTALWADAGMQRARQILVARDGGRAVAFAVADVAEPGLHLYGLVDQVHLFAADESAASNPGLTSCFRALLREVEHWYHQHGAQNFVLFDFEEQDRAHTEGLHNMGDADIVIMSNALIPEFLEYLFEVTSSNAGMHRNPSVSRG